MMRSSGSVLRSARATVRPPNPESKTPRGAAGSREPRMGPVRRPRCARCAVCLEGAAFLHHLLDADAFGTQRRSDVPEYAGMITDREAQVVARFDLFDRHYRAFLQLDAACGESRLAFDA